MKMTKANLTRIMKIEDLSKRKSELEKMAMSIAWHGEVWNKAMIEIARLREMGVKTPLQKAFENSTYDHS